MILFINACVRQQSRTKRLADALAKNFYGIKETALIKATGLDIVGADAESIMNEVISYL